MYKYILEHEKMVKDRLSQGDCSMELYEYHNRQIAWLQHERLIHLIVTLFTTMLLILSFIATMYITNYLIYAVFPVLLVLTFFYMLHYYRLENKVQSWYKLSNEIFRKIN